MRAFGLFFFVITILLYVGCEKSHPSTASGPAGGRQKSQPATVSGLESISRVRLVVKGPSTQPVGLSPNPREEKIDDLQVQAKQLLQKRLPQLNTDGGVDDWTLEAQLAWQREFSYPAAAVWTPPEYWPVCRIRVLKPVVVDGRCAEAVAYEWPVPGPGVETAWKEAGLKNALEAAVKVFVAEWIAANPDLANK